MLSPDAVPNHDRRKLKRIRPLPADIPTSHKREGEDQRDQSRVALSMPARNADLGSS